MHIVYARISKAVLDTVPDTLLTSWIWDKSPSTHVAKEGIDDSSLDLHGKSPALTDQKTLHYHKLW